MSTYEESGVNIARGDAASRRAYEAALSTFASRAGRIGMPVALEGGFAGALDFGAYYLVLGCDGVGTKIDIALETKNFTGLGNDLLAMVADDAVCVGAETVAITNTVDTNAVNPDEIAAMMDSLAAACREQKVVIPGGEIAELGSTLTKTIWNATALGIVEKEKYLSGDRIAAGDAVIALKEQGFRANGFSLVRYVMKNSGIAYTDRYDEKHTWGEMLLSPSHLYHDAVLHLIGRFGEKAAVEIHGIAHITGGGIVGNFSRILKKKKLGAKLPDLWQPSELVRRVQALGRVSNAEAYKTWNMGNGMLIVLPQGEVEKAIQLLAEKGVQAKVAGAITESGVVTL